MTSPAPREVRVRVSLRWRDMDELGHLNQSVYHELLEEGRMALVETLVTEAESFVLARVELDHRREVRREAGHVEVVARVGRIGRSSFAVEHDLVLPDGTPAATGRSVLVAWDARERRPRALSDRERRELGGSP
jgi:acyl-CoA thioester hydrolase